MANCVNCGNALTWFDKGTSFYPDSDKLLCAKCRGIIELKFADFDVRIKKHNLTIDSLNRALPYLRLDGLTDYGEKYLTEYANWAESYQIKELQKQGIDIEQKRLEDKKKAEIKQEELNSKHQEWLNTHGMNTELYLRRKQFKSTTGFDFNGYSIIEYLGIKSGEVVLGTGVFSEFSAGISDLFGTKSVSMANKLTDAKNAALFKLIDNCILIDANAVIGVDIDIMTLGSNMIVACANGTAVKIEPIKSEE